MTSRPQPPEAFGITDDETYELKALPYWQQYSTEEFVRLTYHELVNKQGVVLGFMSVLQEDPRIADIQLNDVFTVREVCEAIIRSTEQTVKFLDIMKAYFIPPKQP